MTLIFKIQDKSGRNIHLTKERWGHITQEHPYLQNIEEIKEALTIPLKIIPSKYDPEHVRYYYRLTRIRKDTSWSP